MIFGIWIGPPTFLPSRRRRRRAGRLCLSAQIMTLLIWFQLSPITGILKALSTGIILLH